MTHECGGGFVTVKIGDRLIDLCESCADEFIRVAGDLEFMLKGKSRIDRVYLSPKDRDKALDKLKSKVNELLNGSEEAPSMIYFFNLSDDDLVRLTDEPYIETGTPDD